MCFYSLVLKLLFDSCHFPGQKLLCRLLFLASVANLTRVWVRVGVRERVCVCERVCVGVRERPILRQL